MTAERIELLGRIAIQRRGAGSGTLPGRRAELVFAFLAAEHHRIVTADELANALWPESLPDTWAAALRGVVTEVRRYLDNAGLPSSEMLTTVRRGYQLQLPAGMVVDLDEARACLAAAGGDLEAGDGARAAVHAARSAELARLPFLAAHDGEWVDGIRRELESLHARALDLQARGHRTDGDLPLAASVAEQLVRVEPLSEAGHQLRIRILGEAGDRAGAIRAYEQCRAVLADELGVQPSAETKAALQEAMHAAATRAATPPPASAAGGASRAGEPGANGDLSVLVVEDHDFQRRTAVRLLHGLGVSKVAEAADGSAALQLLAHSAQPDVIICDIDMPEMDGVEFISRVAQQGLASAVVVASGLDSKVLAAVTSIGEAHGLQLLGAVEKPLTARRLGELLAAYRRHPAARAGGGAQLAVSPAELTAALTAGHIGVEFEPVVDLTEGRVVGAEAVGRWTHPAKGTIPAGVFFPAFAAEDLPRYTEAVLTSAGSAAADCRAAGAAITIGVDLSTAVLAETAVADRVRAIVEGRGAGTSQVTCEVPERSLAEAPQVALDTLTRLRVKGFGLALDHFGARRVPAERLARIPFTEVKVDASLVAGASEERQRMVLLEETLDRARDLGAPVVACGCDSEADFDLVVEMGFRFAQGPFVGAAMGAPALVEWAGSWAPPVNGWARG